MKLSDIKGTRALDIIADVMELAELMSDDDDFKAFLDDLKGIDGDGDKAVSVMLKRIPPLMRNAEYQRCIVSILASANEVTYEEYAENGNVIKDLLELLITDDDSLGFLIGAVSAKTA